jgi:hypothetical protein
MPTAIGRLADMCDQADHVDHEMSVVAWEREVVMRSCASMILCAVRISNTAPVGHTFDLEGAVIELIEKTNRVKHFT